jgi:hypothetical protein
MGSLIRSQAGCYTNRFALPILLVKIARYLNLSMIMHTFLFEWSMKVLLLCVHKYIDAHVTIYLCPCIKEIVSIMMIYVRD